MTREEGKTLAEAKGEVRRAINIFRYFAGEGSRLNGMLVPSERDRVHMFAIRKPIGVVGLVTPWNFPSAIPAWKLAPALICGNTVVLKPASAAPLSAWRIVEALHEAGLPKGVVNFVAGSGGALGQALVDAPPLKAISFTGSCRSATGCTPKPPSAACAFNSKWAARIPPSSWPTPISMPPSRTPSMPPSFPPALWRQRDAASAAVKPGSRGCDERGAWEDLAGWIVGVRLWPLRRGQRIAKAVLPTRALGIGRERIEFRNLLETGGFAFVGRQLIRGAPARCIDAAQLECRRVSHDDGTSCVSRI